MSEQISVEPGMGIEKFHSPTAHIAAGLPGDSPRGPLQQDNQAGAATPTYRHLGVQITADLYARLVAAARHEGSGTSVYVRRLIADHLGEAAAIDRRDGVRVPPAELAGASVLLGHLTQLVIASRELGDGQAAGAIAAMEVAHMRLVKIIERLER